MNKQADPTFDLLDRPEPHFPEGRGWPRTGWLGRALWTMLVVMLAVALIGACWTDMAVEVALGGSVLAAEGAVQVVLVADETTAENLEVGQPVRLRVEDASGWGVIVQLDRGITDLDRPYVRALVAIAGPRPLLEVVIGQACEGQVLIGFLPTIRGLWQLATNQPSRPARGGVEELRRRIPQELRETDRYRHIERDLASESEQGSGLSRAMGGRPRVRCGRASRWHPLGRG